MYTGWVIDWSVEWLHRGQIRLLYHEFNFGLQFMSRTWWSEQRRNTTRKGRKKERKITNKQRAQRVPLLFIYRPPAAVSLVECLLSKGTWRDKHLGRPLFTRADGQANDGSKRFKNSGEWGGKNLNDDWRERREKIDAPPHHDKTSH
jgi:hypothetical protein